MTLAAAALGGVFLLGGVAWWGATAPRTPPAGPTDARGSALRVTGETGKRASDWALYFDGDDASVQLPTLTLPKGPLTVEVWLTSAKTPGEGFIVNSLGPTNVTLLDRGDLGQVSFTWAVGDTSNFAQAPFTKHVNKRTHVAAVWDGERPRLFLDGADVTGPTTALNIAGPKGAFTMIGGSGTKGAANFRGTIYQVRFSKSGRYAVPFRPPERFEADADTLALYRFDEGSGSNVGDASGNGHTGTIVGAKWVRTDRP